MIELFNKTTGIADVFDVGKIHEENIEASKNLTAAFRFDKNEDFREEASKFDNMTCEQKILYPFTSPLRIILCFGYAALLVTFLACFFANDGPSSTGWIIAAVLFTIFTCLVNIYALTIVFCYIVIIVVVIYVILLICIISCLCVSMTSSSPPPNNRNYY